VFKPQLGKKVYARCSSLEYDGGLNALHDVYGLSHSSMVYPET